jgi:DNA-directed RNA polymerase II subunit RPB2
MELVKQFLSYNPPEKIQLNSFNYLIHHSVPRILEKEIIETNQMTLRIENIDVQMASSEVDEGFVTPEKCLSTSTTYSSEIIATITYFFKCDFGNRKTIKVCIGRIPVMVGSDICHLKNVNNIMKCYFIVKGSKKVVCMEERITYNYPFLLAKKKEFKFYKYVEFKSMNDILRSSMIDIGAKFIKNKFEILVYCPELTLRELIPIEWFLMLFLKTEDIQTGLVNISKAVPVEYQSKICEIISNNFVFDVNIDDIYTVIFSHNTRISSQKDVQNVLKERYLIHMIDLPLKDKGVFTMYLLKVLLYGLVDFIPVDDRDHYGNKRVYTINHFFTSELYHIFHKKYKKKLITSLDKSIIQYQLTDSDTVKRLIERNQEITNSFKNCLSSNAWHGKTQSAQYVSQQFDPFNGLHYLDLIRKINTPVKNDSNKILGPRDLHLTQSDILCPYGTPDGKKVGLVKYPSIQSIVTVDESYELVTICKELCKNHLRDVTLSMTMVLVNGYCIGTVESLEKDTVLNILRRIKTDLQKYETSIYYSFKLNSIIVLSDAGRLLYPVITSNKCKDLSFTKSLRRGYMLLLDKNEIEDMMLSEKDIFTNLTETKEYTDFIFSFSLGYLGSLIPYSNHNQAPRNIYQCQMSKQSVGFLMNRDRPFIYHGLMYPQIPLVSTIIQQTEFFYEHPTGINAVVAIMPYMGQNQEDSVILNKSSLDRGLFNSVKELTFRYILDNADVLYSPPPSECSNNVYNFSKLDNTGIIKVNSYVKKDDVLISVKRSDSDRKAEPVLLFQIEDCVTQIKSTNLVVTEKGETIISIVAVELLTPQIGDKFSSRHGQKGTVGMIVSQEDLPFTSDGITPDIIINPLCIPSRMTIGHLLETASGISYTNSSTKICKICLEYKRNLNSPRCQKDCFLSQTIENYLYHTAFYRNLIPLHIKNFKSSEMYCGITGEAMESLIFIGIVYYQRLKHMSRDKVYVRTKGPIQPVTRQPKEGRSVEGGHRFGLQERDCILAHGCVFTLRDRLFLNSDYYKLYICECGTIYHGKDPKNYSFACCKLCKSFKLYIVELPFASKVLIQLLAAFNIHLKLIPGPKNLVFL